MPIYEFLCRDCEHRYDDLVSITADPTSQSCPQCRSGDIAKLYSPFSVGATTSSAGGQFDAGGACLPGPAGAGGGGCCGGGCGGCG